MSDKPKARLYKMSSMLGPFMADAQAAYDAQKSGTARGPKIGFSAKLDRELGGHLAVGLHALHAEPGAGKTALVSQVAANAGCAAMMVNCEMGPVESFRRHIARETKTYLGKLRDGTMEPKEARRLAEQTVAAIPNLALADATLGPLPTDELVAFARAARGGQPDENGLPHLLVVVDSLHSWVRGVDPTLDEYKGLTAGISMLQQFAITEKCAVMVVCERNRVAMLEDGMHSSKGTATLEYACESLWTLSRKKDDKPDGNGVVPVTLTLAKNRQGSPGVKVDLQFTGGFMLFTDVEAKGRRAA